MVKYVFHNLRIFILDYLEESWTEGDVLLRTHGGKLSEGFCQNVLYNLASWS